MNKAIHGIEIPAIGKEDENVLKPKITRTMRLHAHKNLGYSDRMYRTPKGEVQSWAEQHGWNIDLILDQLWAALHVGYCPVCHTRFWELWEGDKRKLHLITFGVINPNNTWRWGTNVTFICKRCNNAMQKTSVPDWGDRLVSQNGNGWRQLSGFDLMGITQL